MPPPVKKFVARRIAATHCRFERGGQRLVAIREETLGDPLRQHITLPVPSA